MTVSGLSWSGLNANAKIDICIGFLRVTKKNKKKLKKVWQVWQVWQVYEKHRKKHDTLRFICHGVVWQNRAVCPNTNAFLFFFSLKGKKNLYANGVSE
jgi:hypothetical protein